MATKGLRPRKEFDVVIEATYITKITTLYAKT